MSDETPRTLAAMMARGDVFVPDCPSRAVLKRITSSWGLLVLVALRDGTRRFSELRRRVNGVSERMLAQTLQQLEAHQLVTRRSLPVVPPHVEYSLTPLGAEAAAKVEDLVEWIQANITALMPLEAQAEAAE
ncbi:winged helix-turn-helix transcriptional regulator [Sphingomonas sp. TDK1]|uniref:winged helix-turn-helix transcriptional regulator n=1 Tax=Sphingomonas sp. TDK1 TaxID=453247 RepID=UPI0007DA47C9|nr:helix-turn-helix domain-containing protein [Sphingomonas sp. TDK1]OAN66888.1 HxlR family transcriptional regulator [Sphingomonas sp. TDK1]